VLAGFDLALIRCRARRLLPRAASPSAPLAVSLTYAAPGPAGPVPAPQPGVLVQAVQRSVQRLSAHGRKAQAARAGEVPWRPSRGHAVGGGGITAHSSHRFAMFFYLEGWLQLHRLPPRLPPSFFLSTAEAAAQPLPQPPARRR
jgi:hypothetical protein